jgi:uncharacterized protein
MLNNLIKEFEIKRELYIKVKVSPGATKSEVKEVMTDGTIKISIAAQPIKGQANQELIKYLSKSFNCRKTDIKILTGAGEKTKLVKISNNK